jgi:anti-anti-sigma factor
MDDRRLWMTEYGEMTNVVEIEEPAPRTLLVRVRGDLDGMATEQLRAALDDELAGSSVSRLVLDLSRVTLLASPALDLLRRLRRRCRVEGRNLVLVGTGHPAVHRPLRITGLLPLFDTRPTVQSVLHGAARPVVTPVDRPVVTCADRP